LAGRRISPHVIASLYQVLRWYQDNKGAPKSAQVLNLFELWRNLHASFFNISDKGWRAIEGLADSIEKSLNISVGVRGRNDRRWLFLYALETYLNIVMRAVTLSKLGSAPADIRGFAEMTLKMRNIFEPNVFEWIFEALDDQSLPEDLRGRFMDSINMLLDILYNLDLLHVTTDMFREVYQDILPPEVRKSLGEFYTNDEIVNRVLDAVELDPETIRTLYARWEDGFADTIILDPACGSGSFLVNVVKRVFSSFGDRVPRDITRFVEDNIVGIDINPFAVEMAKLNMVIAISNEMAKRGGAYMPSNLRIYWADSLSRPKVSKGNYGESILVVQLPALQRITGVDSIKIPFCPGIDPVMVLDMVDKLASSGKGVKVSLERVVAELVKACGSVPEEILSSYLKNLYDVLKSIHDSGNSRVIAMIKNIVAVQSLIGRCSYVIGNPPWVRIHNIDENVVKYLRENYRWFKDPSYNPKFKKTKTPFREQVDYSIAFVERGLEFLRGLGVLSYVITSKVAKATYAGKMREDLVKNYTILELVDYSLYPVQMFKDVVNYPLIISVRKIHPGENHRVKVTVYNTTGSSTSFEVEQKALPLYADTNYPNRDRSPWVLAPPEVLASLKKILKSSHRLGDIYEIVRGVETDLNEGYIGRVVGCDQARRLVRIQLESGEVAGIEEFIVHPVVRGESVDPYSFTWDEFIIFPHDTMSFEPLWDRNQRTALEALGLLGRGIEVEASGGVLEYVREYVFEGVDDIEAVRRVCLNRLNASIQEVRRRGFQVVEARPCMVDMCLNVSSEGGHVLNINIEVHVEENRCSIKYSVAGLRIPGAPQATRHFARLFEKLVRRESYKASLPPWAVFAVAEDKFREYRVAWQEMAKQFEAAYLPLHIQVELCGSSVRKLLVPIQTAYFIVEKDPLKALKLLLYLNSDLARSLIKLWAWVARGGYYRHTSYNTGMLPIPSALVNNTLWSFVENYLRQHEGALDLNTIAVNVLNNAKEKLEKELLESLMISEEEYRRLVEYGKWLNELGAPPQAETEEEGELLEEE
jgi:SAM-dependent methyltransferase